MTRELIDVVDALGEPRVAVVGDLMLDEYVYGDADRISPEAPIQILTVDSNHAEFRLGGAGAVAGNLRALEAAVSVFGACGDDRAGDELTKRLGDLGADVSGLVRLADRPTTLKTRYIGRAQHRIPQQVLRVDREDASPLAADPAERLLAAARRAIASGGAVVLSDYRKGVVTADLARDLTSAAREAGVPVLVDPHPRADYETYRGATLVTPNRFETEIATGIRPVDEATAHEAAEALVADYNLGAVLVTMDKDGAYLLQAGGEGWLFPTRPRQVFDNAGAGDMVVAVLALVLAAGRPMSDAVRLANVAAGLEVEKFGVQPVARDEIVADLLGEARRAGDKVRRLENLRLDLDRHRALGDRIVFTNGCFDLLHAGHIEYLDYARSQGDVLVVGLNSDRSVRAMDKGPQRPIVPEDQRARVLSGLEAVDYVVLFDEDTPAELIEAVEPDVLVKGEDWAEEGVVGREFVEARGGRVVLAPLVGGLSTTDLVDRIRRAETSRTEGDAP